VLATFANVIATPAPTAAEPPAALPSAFDAAAAISDAVIVNAPALTVTPTGNIACDDALTIVTETAAATETGPPEVDADGACVKLEPEPPAAADWLPADPRASETWPSTPPDGAEDEVPFADAVAEPLVVDVPDALNVAAPVTFNGRAVVTVTECVASITATAAPTAAVAAADEPDAVSVTDAVCVAKTTSAPPIAEVAPVPIDASVVTFESDTATDGAIETPPPAVPDFDVVVRESFEDAWRERSCAFVNEPFASAAWVESVTRFSATDAPKPAPDTPAVALAWESLTEVALRETLPLVGDSGGPRA
jgi:hypothetical protein